MRYNDKLKSLKCGRIVPPSRWDGPDRVPMEVRSQHDNTYALILAMRRLKSLNFWSIVRKFPGLTSFDTMRNPPLKSKSRQHTSQPRISTQIMRKCIGSSGHSYGVLPISLYGTYCWGHSPALTNQTSVLKWRYKYVNEGWWNLGHRTCLEV